MGAGKEDFNEFAAATWPGLVRTAMLLGCSHPDAEDLAQTALVKCLRSWGRVQSATDPVAYAHRVLINAHISNRRRFWHREEPTAAPPVHDGGAPNGPLHEDRADIRDALARLPNDQRVAVVLRYYLDYSEDEMANVQQVARGTVKSRLSRALRSLALDPALAYDEERL